MAFLSVGFKKSLFSFPFKFHYNFLSAQIASHAAFMRLIISDASRT